MSKFTCPFCLQEYKKSKVLYECPDCGTLATRKLFEREPVKCAAPGCGGFATVRKCPSCHEVIPKTALETPNLPFSIIGVSNSGKTNYITVMLEELQRSSPVRLALGHQTNETRDHQAENRRRIYEEHTRPESTQAGQLRPQIWYIKNLRKQTSRYTPTYTFTIFDGAGEDHENKIDPSSTVCRYIKASKAIIFVMDPLTLERIRKDGEVDPNVIQNSLGGNTGETKNAAAIVNSVADYIKTARGIHGSIKLNIPVAVVLTKFDTVINHSSFGQQALIKNRSLNVQNGKVNASEFEEIDDNIRKWLEVIGESSFIDALGSHFNDFQFFGVSSYGAPPEDKDTLVKNIKPHRVLDPILWLFKKSKFID